MTATSHTYIRCVNVIYVGDANEQWRELHRFETEKRAKRWQNDQNKKRPDSVIVGHRPTKLVLVDRDLKVRRELARQSEIRRLARDQARDAARNPSSRPKTQGLSGKTAKLAQSAVAPDHGGSSYLRDRSKKRQQSRNARNTRASFGAS